MQLVVVIVNFFAPQSFSSQFGYAAMGAFNVTQPTLHISADSPMAFGACDSMLREHI